MPDHRKGKLGEAATGSAEYLGLSQEYVAQQTGIPRPAISEIEAGRRKVDSLELKRLSKLYGQTDLNFSWMKTRTTQSVRRRTPVELKLRPMMRSLKEEEQRRDFEIRRVSETPTQFGQSEGDMDQQQLIVLAMGAAHRAHRDFGIDPRSRVDVFGALRQAGAYVFFSPLKSMYGAYLPSKDSLPVLINSNLPLSTQRYTAAHELGHVFLKHKTVSLDMGSGLRARATIWG